MKIAIIDKAPSRVDYKKYFTFEFDLFHLSSVPVPKLLKKNIDIIIETDEYDYILLVGSEATKEFTKISSVTNYAGQLVNDKYLPLTNPSILIFKPEGKQDFERAVGRINEYISGERVNVKDLGDFKGIDTADEAYEFLLEVLHNATEYVALDCEATALYPRNGYVLGISITYKSKHGRYILTDVLDDRCIEVLQQIVDKYSIIFHNLKYDVKMISFHLGIKFDRKRSHDTMVMHYCLDEVDGHGLKALALKYTDYGDYDKELDEFKKDYCKRNDLLLDDFTYDLIPYDVICRYASIDTAATFEIFLKFWPALQKNPKLVKVYQEILLPGTFFLMDMEEVGIPISKDRLLAADEYLAFRIRETKEQLYEIEAVKQFENDSKSIFNPASPIQVRKVLFDYLRLDPTGKLTATGAISTDAEVLEELAEQHPLPKLLLTMRQLSKIRNTYVTKILPELDRDSRIRTNFNLIFTTSGRLSSSGRFNAQQIVRDDPIIKGCIKAPPGYKIVSQDLRTAEVYYAAVLSGDKNMQAVFSSGGDLHSTIAKMVFDLPCEVADVKKLYPAMRQAAKAITFGILYGSGAKKVAETVSKETGQYYSLSEAQDNINDYFTKFSKLKTWLKSRENFIKTNGFTYSFFGRKRRLSNVFSEDKGMAAHEVRSGINMEIQSVASDINLFAAMEAQAEIDSKKLDSKIFMLVHDSVVGLVREDLVEEYCEILQRNTQKDRGCSIPGFPVGVDQEIGDEYSFGKFDKVYRLEGTKLSRI